MSSIIVESPQQEIVEYENDLAVEARLLQTEHSKLLKRVGESEKQLCIFKEGVLKLKQYYDMQMLVMKSHLHGEEEESLETFFGKLIRIMEFVKQIFLFLDSSCVGYHGDDNYVELCQPDDVRSSSKEPTETDYSGTSNVSDDPPSSLIPGSSLPQPSSPFLQTLPLNHQQQQQHHHQQHHQRQQQQQDFFLNDIPATVEVSEDLPQISTAMYSSSSNLQDEQEQHINYQRLYASKDLSTQNPAGSSSSISNTDRQYISVEARDIAEEICSVCKNTFTTKRDLNRHMRRHTGEKPFRCEVCLKDFSRKDFLLKHKLTHTGEKPHKCCQCEKRFSQRSNLNKHMATHTKNHRFICKICRRGFHQMINLHRHEQLHCATNKHFQCTWCSKVQYQGVGCLKTFLDKRDSNTE